MHFPCILHHTSSTQDINFFVVIGDPVDTTKSWEWGGFPSVSQTNSPTSDDSRQEEHRSMLSGMFSFMKQKHGTQNPLDGGMYLSDITSGSVDQGVAEIYFNTNKDKKSKF